MNLKCLIAITTTLVLSACSTAPSPLRGGSAPDRQTLAALAEEITNGVGQVLAISPGRNAGTVFVMEEQHASISGQLEIAVMLLRLHERGWRLTGLEGAPAGQVIDASWFHAGGPAPDDAALQMLADGEISAPEALALFSRDARVAGIETPNLYGVDLEIRGWPEATYLLLLAQASLAPAESARLTELARAGKAGEVSLALRKSDPWVQARWNEMERTDADIEEVSARLREVRGRAEARRLSIDAAVRLDFDRAVAFFETAARRSDAMAVNLLASMQQSNDVRASMVAGAGHDRGLRAALGSRGLGFVVIRPSSFARPSARLSDPAFDRKSKRRWAGNRGLALGCALNAARKPPPVLTEATGRSYLWAQEAVRTLSRAHRDGKQLEGARTTLVLSADGAIELVRPDGADVVVRLKLKDTAGQDRTVWARARASRRLDEDQWSGKTKEQKLLALVTSLRGEQRDRASADTAAMRIGTDVQAVFGASEKQVASLQARTTAPVPGCDEAG